MITKLWDRVRRVGRLIALGMRTTNLDGSGTVNRMARTAPSVIQDRLSAMQARHEMALGLHDAGKPLFWVEDEAAQFFGGGGLAFLTSRTGGGKSMIMPMLIAEWNALHPDEPVTIITIGKIEPKPEDD